MKIGIYTYFYGANYGAQAHSYALYQTLTEMGHNCEFVSYYPKSRFYVHKKSVRSLLGYDRSIFTFRSLKTILTYGWHKGLHNNYNFSARVNSGNEIDALDNNLVIFGSDEVFTVHHLFCDKVSFGVGVNATPKITYAPSAGETDVATVLDDDIKESLGAMLFLSARDKNTAELIKNNCQREVSLVLDPTLIYDFTAIAENLPYERYILIYAFRELDEYKEHIKEYAKEKGLPIVSIARSRRWADKSYSAASVPQWLGAFSRAALVVTDSFHGTIFSIKSQCEFINTGFVHNTNKLNNLRMDMGVERPNYNGETSIEQHISKYPINFAEINEIIAQKKADSLEYLIKAIKAASQKAQEGIS